MIANGLAAGGIVMAEEPKLFALTYQAQVESPELDVMIVGTNMLQFDWYWDQLALHYGDRMPDERPAYYLDRIELIVSENMGLVPIYSTNDDRPHHELFTLIPEGDLFKVEF